MAAADISSPLHCDTCPCMRQADIALLHYSSLQDISADPQPPVFQSTCPLVSSVTSIACHMLFLAIVLEAVSSCLRRHMWPDISFSDIRGRDRYTAKTQLEPLPDECILKSTAGVPIAFSPTRQMSLVRCCPCLLHSTLSLGGIGSNKPSVTCTM